MSPILSLCPLSCPYVPISPSPSLCPHHLIPIPMSPSLQPYPFFRLQGWGCCGCAVSPIGSLGAAGGGHGTDPPWCYPSFPSRHPGTPQLCHLPLGKLPANAAGPPPGPTFPFPLQKRLHHQHLRVSTGKTRIGGPRAVPWVSPSHLTHPKGRSMMSLHWEYGGSCPSPRIPSTCATARCLWSRSSMKVGTQWEWGDMGWDMGRRDPTHTLCHPPCRS